MAQKRGRQNQRRERRLSGGETDRCMEYWCLVLHVLHPSHSKAGSFHGLVDPGGALTCLMRRGAAGASLDPSHLRGPLVTMFKEAVSWIMDLKRETKTNI